MPFRTMPRSKLSRLSCFLRPKLSRISLFPEKFSHFRCRRHLARYFRAKKRETKNEAKFPTFEWRLINEVAANLPQKCSFQAPFSTNNTANLSINNRALFNAAILIQCRFALDVKINRLLLFAIGAWIAIRRN